MERRLPQTRPSASVRMLIRHAGEKEPERGYNPYLHLSDEERFRQIGEILHRAARLYWRRERLAGRASPVSPPGNSTPCDIVELTDDEAEKNILRCLRQSDSASPGQIGARLGIAHTTLVRKLARLKAAGLVIVTGKTKGARYELAGPGQRN